MGNTTNHSVTRPSAKQTGHKNHVVTLPASTVAVSSAKAKGPSTHVSTKEPTTYEQRQGQVGQVEGPKREETTTSPYRSTIRGT